ncbi:MAG: hypothetical protein IAF94_20540 [Pirellulaceae bacterium]|nr:hypothetical protein [Pirellulaceae bacterium]
MTATTRRVSIAVGGVFGPRTNLDDQPLDAPLMTGANTVVQDLSLGQRLIYRGDTVSLEFEVRGVDP